MKHHRRVWRAVFVFYLACVAFGVTVLVQNQGVSW